MKYASYKVTDQYSSFDPKVGKWIVEEALVNQTADAHEAQRLYNRRLRDFRMEYSPENFAIFTAKNMRGIIGFNDNRMLARSVIFESLTEPETDKVVAHYNEKGGLHNEEIKQ